MGPTLSPPLEPPGRSGGRDSENPKRRNTLPGRTGFSFENRRDDCAVRAVGKSIRKRRWGTGGGTGGRSGSEFGRRLVEDHGFCAETFGLTR